MTTTKALKCTLYYLCLEGDYPAGADATFLGVDGKPLHTGSSEFVKAARIEGSAKLNDGRVLNYAGGERWAVVTAPFGLGSLGCPLIPLRSAAVDKSVVPLRSILHIPETVGLLLPDGTKHDGRWFAMDVGGGIQGDRIDLFVGSGKSSMQAVYGFGIGHMQPLNTTILGSFSGCPDQTT